MPHKTRSRKSALFLRSIAFVTVSLGAAGLAHAAEPIEHTENTFHQAVCSRSVAPGQARCHAHVVTDSQGNRLRGKAATAASNAAPAGFAPADLRSAYGVTTVGSPKTIIAIVDAYGYPNAEADMNAYRKQFGLPACTSASGCFVKMNQSGGTTYPTYNASWAVEQALDIEMASAMCPDCTIMLVQTNSNSLVDFALAVNEAIAKGATVVSNSYGGTETGTTGLAPYYSHAGVAITASGGDSGYGVQFPATAPGVIGVGGTILTKAPNTARGWSETAWSGTGSGCSTVYAKPAWQTDKLCTKRTQNDISAVASPSSPVAIYGPTGGTTANPTSGWMMVGGTSVAAPLIGGIYASLDAKPNAASSIYASTATLNDVTTGSDGSCKGTYLCTAEVGYDAPTGMGTPKGASAF